MSLTTQVNDDLKSAMRAKDKLRMQTLRSLKSALMIDASRSDLSENEELAILSKAAKQRRDSANTYRDAGRDELCETELAELAILESYLPKQVSQSEIEKIVVLAIEETGATSKKDMGIVMKTVMPQLKGKADGKIIQNIVKKTLVNE